MKKSAIIDIFHGSKGHIESMPVPKNIKQSMETVCSAFDELKEKLSTEIFELHQKFVDALENSWADEVDFYFAGGFKLGLLVGIECAEE